MIWHVDLGSFWRGIRAMSANQESHQPRWSIVWRSGLPKKFWMCLWTPTWHSGRGPYISIGLGIVAIYRGY